jgi:hypothetical protein
VIIRNQSSNPGKSPFVMTPSFSPVLAHLLMAGLVRRATLSSDARAQPLDTEWLQSPGPDPAEGIKPPAQPSVGTAAIQ